MIRKVLTAGGVLLLLAVLFLPAPAYAQQPNVLVVVIDDWGTDYATSYGAANGAPTPRIDAFASANTRFKQLWASPLCSPTRGSLLTGTGPLTHGFGQVWQTGETQGLTPGLATLADAFKADGYATGIFGKWHLGFEDGVNTPQSHGFDNTEVIFLPLQTAEDIADLYNNYEATTNGVTVHNTMYATTWIADRTQAWIAAQTGPWFAYMAFSAAHVPLGVPPWWLHKLDTRDTSNENKYRMMLAAMDNELGRVLDILDPDDIVVIVSDDGSPSEVSGSKGLMTQAGIRVPGFARVPGQLTLGGLDEPLGMEDLCVSILGWAGVDVPVTMTGVQYPTGINRIINVQAYTPNHGTQPFDTWKHSARDEQYKLARVEYPTVEAFYDLIADPTELSPLNIGSLTGPQQTAYDALKAVLDAQIVP